MKKTSLIGSVSVLLLLFVNSCSKNDTTTTQPHSNLKVTLSVPSSGFEAQSKIIVYVQNLATSSNPVTDSTTSNGTVSFNLSDGNYIVYAQSPTNETPFIQCNYHTNGNFGQPVTISGSDIQNLSFTNWCQLTASSPTTPYCN